MVARTQKPSKLKILEGNRGKRPIPTNEPHPKIKAPPMPDDIDDGAKEVWKRLASQIEDMGMLAEIDGDMLAMVCQVRSRLVAIHKYIKTENPSLVQETRKCLPDGREVSEIKTSPYVVMEKQYYTIFRMLAAEFGLSPRGRVGLQVGMGDGDEGENLIK